MGPERVLTIVLYIFFAASAILNQPHGIVEITNVNPRNPKIIVDEETNSMIPIAIARIGEQPCKYAAEVSFKCLERTAKDGLDFKCHYQKLKWKDGECNTEKIVFITIYNDNEYEESEEFLFQLISDSENNIALGFDRVLIVIPQNDINYGEIGIFPSDVSVIEGMSVELQIQRMFGKTNKARVCYQIISGTAKINFDVTFMQDCIEWQHNNDETHSITVETLSDDLWEDNEVFYVKLLNVEGAQLNKERIQSNITILRNNLNVPLISSSIEPCLESKKEIRINPTKDQQFFVQFEVSLPNLCTVNDAHLIAEHITESKTSLQWIVLAVHGLIMEETSVSCDNIPNAYNIISNKDDNTAKVELNCESIIHHKIIIDRNTNYTCDLTVECLNFNATHNHPKYINNNTILSDRKQRLFCKDRIANSNNISCECDFPTIYGPNEWFISVENMSFGNKYASQSVAYDIFELTQQSLWNNHSLATFIFEIKAFGKSEGINADLTTNWIFYLVTDAYPCQPTEWSNWTECDAKPVGIGHIYRNRIAVHGLSGQELMCNELKQHKMCVVNQDKTVSFSRVKVRVSEGDNSGAIIRVRLNHELTANEIMNKSEMRTEELHSLKGFDVIICFEIPQFYKKEIVIDPNKIGWHRDEWDIVHEIKITALDDSNIDAFEQTILVTPQIHSIDTEYNALPMNTLTIIVEDNEKCRYCGVGNIEPFNPEPKPPFWDFKSIAILAVFLLMIVFLARRGYLWFKSKYGVSNEYDQLKNDGLMEESTEISQSKTQSKTTQSSSSTSTTQTSQTTQSYSESESDDDDDDIDSSES